MRPVCYPEFVPQIFFFTGENSFALRQKYTLWLKEFAEKHGVENLSRMEAQGLTYRRFLDEISAAPFIAEKRLVVVQGVPRWEKEEIESIPNVIHPAVIVLFVDEAPDRRLSGTKALLKLATVETFEPLTPANLGRWIDGFAQEQGATFQMPAKAELLKRIGNDQQRLANEIQKLALFAEGRPIAKKDVEILVSSTAEQQVWGLMDLLGRGDRKAALPYLRYQARDESEQGLWNILLWMLSNVAPIAGVLATSPNANAATIAKQAGVKPMTVQSLLPLAKRLTKPGVEALVNMVVMYDIGLKTGGYRMTTGQGQEVACLLDRVVMACCEPSRGR